MSQSNESFQKRWENHVEKLIKISAKKIGAVEAKHQQIVEGACKVFFQKGFHPTSMREIAESVGMSLGQMYHYISSKDDVLFLIHKHMQTAWYQSLTNARIEEIEDPSKKLEQAFRETLAFLVEHAGGRASTGERRILDVETRSLHQRSPLVIGSAEEVALYESFLKNGRPS